MSRKLFGTDGIRAVAGEYPMTARFAFDLGVALSETLKSQTQQIPSLVIGTDTRRSGAMLAQGLSSGAMSRGASVTFLGVLPTPAVSHLTRALNADAGVMISASHNPFEDNGIKLFADTGHKLDDDTEQTLETYLAQGRELEPVTGQAIGDSQRYRHTQDDYLNFLLEHAPYLDGMRVGLDCANGASYRVAPRIFRQIGARLDVINAHPDGLNINVQCGSTHPEAMQRRMEELELDVGITFDGDADRALLIDKRGRVVTGDHILAICALARGEQAIVATLMSNLGVERYLAKQSVTMHRSDVGDRYVYQGLLEHNLSLGGEQSGHILFLDKAPSGDGILTALQTLAAVRKSGRSLEDWLDDIPLYPQTLLNVRVAPESKASLQNHAEVKKAVAEAEAELAERGRINLRPSGTEPLIRVMVEGEDLDKIETVAKRVAAVVESAA